MNRYMKRFWGDAKNILSGNIKITNRLKFMTIIFSVTMVHLFLTIIFGSLRIMPLFLFNIFSVCTYVSCIFLVRKDIFLPVYYTTYLEIILHSMIATLCLGWKFGFAQYIIAIIPVGYYICYTMNIKRHKMMIATISAFVAVFIFYPASCFPFIVSHYIPLKTSSGKLVCMFLTPYVLSCF